MPDAKLLPGAWKLAQAGIEPARLQINRSEDRSGIPCRENIVKPTILAVVPVFPGCQQKGR